MSVVRNDRLEVLLYLKKSVVRMRQLAAEKPSRFGDELHTIADQIVRDAANLEAELVAAGYIAQPATGDGAAIDYRLYLVNEKGSIQGREDFAAPDDDAALAVASLVCRAVSDVCHSFELWDGERKVRGFDASHANNLLGLTDEQTIRVQGITLKVEETIQQSTWHIARSEKLIGEAAKLLEERSRTPDARQARPDNA